MLSIDVYTCYAVSGAGSLVGLGLLAMVRTEQARVRYALGLFRWALLCLSALLCVQLSPLSMRPEVLKGAIGFAGMGAQPPYPRFWDDYHSANAYKIGKDGKREVVPDTHNITMTADPELDKLIDKHRLAETEDEVQRLSWELSKIIHDRANSIPAWESPFYRYLCWRWLRWPKTGNARQSQLPLDAMVYWIDEDIKRETQKAMREGKDFGEVLRVFDTFQRK